MIGQYLGAGTGITKALYRLENVNDSSGNSKTLTNTNSVTFDAGRFANAANFGTANTNKRLSIADNLGITGGAITISLWVLQLTEISTGKQTFAMQGCGTTQFINNIITYDYNAGTRRISFNRQIQAISNNEAFVTATLGTTNWHLITYVYDATNLTGYVDGVAGTPLATSGSGSSVAANQFMLGHDGGQFSNGYASCKIDECIVENVAWSASKIKKYYTWSRGRFI